MVADGFFGRGTASREHEHQGNLGRPIHGFENTQFCRDALVQSVVNLWSHPQQSALDLSVIIVNYNVESFLSQCLVSVERAVQAMRERGLDAEVFVVDNRSVDGSCARVRRDFPWVRLEALDENLGFAKANNLAIRKSAGRWVLLLNPDTLVREDTFWKVMSFADSQPRLGGLGVPMVDGDGRFLPESKRGRPTPAASFWKITGLYRLSPRSERLNRYYMGHLPADENAQIEVLSGAFMWMRKETLDQVGTLDERYFMYGEDIDLSVRIADGGWENHYYAGTSIVHYKGESTKKGSLNYVLVFYKAMLIYAEQHLAGRQAWLFHQLISLAIYMRAGMAMGARLVNRFGLQVLEWALMLGALGGSLNLYSRFSGIPYDWERAWPSMGVYALVWTCSMAWSGGYDRPWQRMSMARGVLLGSVLLLVAYGLLPNQLRFSRALLLIGTVEAMFITQVLRSVINRSGFLKSKANRQLIVASATEQKAIVELMNGLLGHESNAAPRIALHPHKDGQEYPDFVGNAEDLSEAMRVHRIEEVIFSGRELSMARIIDLMSAASGSEAKFRIAWTEDSHLIGAGGPVTDPLTDLARSMNRRSAKRAKRTFDILLALGLWSTAPVWLVSGQGIWLRHALRVLLEGQTWVGYAGTGEGLPELPKSLVPRTWSVDNRVIRRMDLAYARDYRMRTDLMVIREALISRSAIHRHGIN